MQCLPLTFIWFGFFSTKHIQFVCFPLLSDNDEDDEYDCDYVPVNVQKTNNDIVKNFILNQIALLTPNTKKPHYLKMTSVTKSMLIKTIRGKGIK